jgi:hypothetical protein
MTTTRSETRISREHAQKILELAGWSPEDIREEIDRGQDYYLVTDSDGDEHLWGYGEDEPTWTNHTTTSWYSPW